MPIKYKCKNPECTSGELQSGDTILRCSECKFFVCERCWERGYSLCPNCKETLITDTLP